MKRWLLGFVAAIAAAGTLFAAVGDYPVRPVRIIVPTAPSGGVDLLARLLAQQLGARLGEQFFVDNRPGAAGMIGARTVSAAAPDGYTLLMAPSSIAIATAIKKAVPFDLTRDLTPIMDVAETPYALIVTPTLPVHSVQELIAYAKANPGKLNFGSAGYGSASHLAGELFATMAGIQMTHVPNKSMGPAMLDVMSGVVSVLFGGLPASLAEAKAGKLKVLAVAGARRSPLLPDLPTVAEAGLPGFAINNWVGLLAPAGLDPKITAPLHDEIVAILDAPDTRKTVVEAGFDPIGDTPAAFAALLLGDVKKWHAIAERAGALED